MNGITRIKQQFDQGKVFAAYLTAGDGGIKRTLEAALALIAAGVTLLEIGVPFSDPIADGPVIQRAATRALSANTTMHDIIGLIKQIRQHSTIPLILFSYLNPMLVAYHANLFDPLQQAGLDGLLLVDCPIEEAQSLRDACIQREIALINVISASTSAERIRKINQRSQGFLYYACRKGVTGMRSHLPEDLAEKIALIKANSALPVLTGFGIASADDAKQALQHADGVVVGSLFVQAMENGLDAEQLRQLALTIAPIKPMSKGGHFEGYYLCKNKRRLM